MSLAEGADLVGPLRQTRAVHFPILIRRKAEHLSLLHILARLSHISCIPKHPPLNINPALVMLTEGDLLLNVHTML